MKRLILMLLVTPHCWGAYAASATVTIPAATGSTQSNQTFVVTGSDVKLKTVANGGQVTHTTTRLGITVPTDLAFGSVAGCGTLYSYDVAAYDPVAGTVVVWILIPTLTTSSSIIVNVCLGNSAVTTYQGGAVGAAYDTSAQQLYHLGEASNPYYDSTSGGRNSTSGTYPSQVAGKIGKAQSFVSTSSNNIIFANNPGFNDMTYIAWIKTSSTGAASIIDSRQPGCGPGSLLAEGSGNVGGYRQNTGIVSETSVNIADGNWHQIVATFLSINIVIYVDGVALASGGNNPYTGESVGDFAVGRDCGGTSLYTGVLEEVESWLSTWSADRVATSFANQNSPPVIGAFSGGVSAVVSTSPIIY